MEGAVGAAPDQLVAHAPGPAAQAPLATEGPRHFVILPGPYPTPNRIPGAGRRCTDRDRVQAGPGKGSGGGSWFHADPPPGRAQRRNNQNSRLSTTLTMMHVASGK